jgi:hypothetical protein
MVTPPPRPRARLPSPTQSASRDSQLELGLSDREPHRRAGPRAGGHRAVAEQNHLNPCRRGTGMICAWTPWHWQAPSRTGSRLISADSRAGPAAQLGVTARASAGGAPGLGPAGPALRPRRLVRVPAYQRSSHRRSPQSPEHGGHRPGLSLSHVAVCGRKPGSVSRVKRPP